MFTFDRSWKGCHVFRQHLVGIGRQNVGSVRWKLLVLLRKVKLQTRLEPRFYLAKKKGHLLALKNIPLMWKQSQM